MPSNCGLAGNLAAVGDGRAAGKGLAQGSEPSGARFLGCALQLA